VFGEKGIGSAFTWTKASGFTNLPVPSQKNISRAFGMNAAGDVVGDSSLANGASTAGTVWKSTGQNTLLSPFNSTTYFLSTAVAINNSRTIAGYSFNNLDQIATVWNFGLASGQWTAQSIGTLGGADSTAYDINNAGIVVGQASRALGHGIGAFLWHPGDAAPTDLDPTQAFGGANTFARGINSFNTVVGIIGGGSAFVWDQAHGIRDLQTLIDPQAPWLLRDAEHVNNSGWIIGTAINSNDSLEHAVILRPAFVLGDFNLNGLLDPSDIQAGLNALTDLHAYQTAHNLSDADLRAIGDINGDYNPATGIGGVNNLDIQSLLDLIAASGSGSGSIETVPEPAALVTALLGVAVIVRRRPPGRPGAPRRFCTFLNDRDNEFGVV
jgi:hypothetical protein